MKKFVLIIVFSCFGLCMAWGNQANASILTFDDIAERHPLNPRSVGDFIAYGYGGFRWQSVFDIHKTKFRDSGYSHGAISGDYVAFTHSGGVVTRVASDSSFTLNGMFITAAWVDSLIINIEGKSGDQNFYSKDITLSNENPVWINLDWTGITQFKFNTVTPLGPGQQFAIDNLTHNEPIAPVPEPATMVLLGTGIAGLACGRLRRNRKA